MRAESNCTDRFGESIIACADGWRRTSRMDSTIAFSEVDPEGTE